MEQIAFRTTVVD